VALWKTWRVRSMHERTIFIKYLKKNKLKLHFLVNQTVGKEIRGKMIGPLSFHPVSSSSRLSSRSLIDAHASAESLVNQNITNTASLEDFLKSLPEG
jgi:hypothetical protein